MKNKTSKTLTLKELIDSGVVFDPPEKSKDSLTWHESLKKIDLLPEASKAMKQLELASEEFPGLRELARVRHAIAPLVMEPIPDIQKLEETAKITELYKNIDFSSSMAAVLGAETSPDVSKLKELYQGFFEPRDQQGQLIKWFARRIRTYIDWSTLEKIEENEKKTSLQMLSKAIDEVLESNFVDNPDAACGAVFRFGASFTMVAVMFENPEFFFAFSEDMVPDIASSLIEQKRSILKTHRKQQGKEGHNHQFGKAIKEVCDFAREYWEEEIEDGKKPTRIGAMVKKAREMLSVDLSAVGLKRCPTEQTIKNWILAGVDVPEEARKGGREPKQKKQPPLQ